MKEAPKTTLLRGLYDQEQFRRQREEDIALLERSLAVAHADRVVAEGRVLEFEHALIDGGVMPGEIQASKDAVRTYVHPQRVVEILDRAAHDVNESRRISATAPISTGGVR